MLEYVKRQWMNKFRTLFFIIIGFVVGNLVLSCGISISVETITRQRDMTNGNPYIQTLINLESETNMSPQNVGSFCEGLSEYGEVQILSADKVTVDVLDEKYILYPVLFSKTEDWHIPIVEGRYFEPDEMFDGNKVIIGKNIAKKANLHENSTIFIEGRAYKVIGLGGRANRGTEWDDLICMPWGNFTEYYSNMLNKQHVTLFLKSGKDKVISNYKEDNKMANELGIDYSYEDISETMDVVDENNNSIIITIIASVLIFIIVIINITNLMLYWIIDRKKDLAVFKAIGASNTYLTKCITLEVVAMTVIGFVFALILQYILNITLGEILRAQDIYMDISILNIGICLLVTMTCGVLASIIPSRIIMSIQPAESIKE